jgi:hypothetical protein
LGTHSQACDTCLGMRQHEPVNTSNSRKPLACKEPLAYKEPSAYKEPLACKKPSAYKEPLAF